MISYYFIGIGGTAMGSVAVALRQLGHEVSGSDSGVYSPMSDFLSSSGITYFNTFDETHLPNDLNTMIVVGNAISRGNPELEAALNKRMILKSLPEVVSQELIRQHYSIVVSGTHGKTTTTSLLCWLLEQANLSPGFLLGGIHRNFNCGCRPAQTLKDQGYGYFVIEGDEYDTAFFDKRSKFLHYRPNLAIINNIEFDHADIFPDIHAIYHSFSRLIHLIPKNGLLLVSSLDKGAVKLAQKSFCKVERFGLEPEANWRAVDIQTSSTGASFTALHNNVELGRLKTPLFGEHNCRNALACVAASHAVGLSLRDIQNGLMSFSSPKRRLEVLFNQNNLTLIDDFAHHPTAIHETLKATTQMFPNRRIIACFEPRSNTSTRNIFQNDFIKAFDLADSVVLGPVNRPERYSDDARLDTQAMLKALKEKGKTGYAVPLPKPENYVERIVSFLKQHLKSGDVLLVLSNGSFGGLITQLKTMLLEETHNI